MSAPVNANVLVNQMREAAAPVVANLRGEAGEMQGKIVSLLSEEFLEFGLEGVEVSSRIAKESLKELARSFGMSAEAITGVENRVQALEVQEASLESLGAKHVLSVAAKISGLKDQITNPESCMKFLIEPMIPLLSKKLPLPATLTENANYVQHRDLINTLVQSQVQEIQAKVLSQTLDLAASAHKKEVLKTMSKLDLEELMDKFGLDVDAAERFTALATSMYFNELRAGQAQRA